MVTSHYSPVTNHKVPMDFKKQKSIYLQIADTLCERIVSGEWKPDDRIPSVRDVAVEMGVNPNTVLRSFDQLQSSEIIYNRRGVGYFAASDAVEKILEIQRREFLEEEWPAVLQKMKMLNLNPEELLGVV